MGVRVSRVDELARALSSWVPGDRPATTWFLPELRELLRANFAGAYLPAATDAGWSLDFMHGAGAGASDHIRIFGDYVSKLPSSETFLTLGNPHLVQVEQRNRVLPLSSIARLQGQQQLSGPFLSLFRTLRISGHDQLRILVCDGPRQLAWIGATREEPFTPRETRILRRLAKPLQERLRLERQLARPALLATALEAALEAVPSAAFVVGPRGDVDVANSAGLALLERDRRAVLASLRESEQRPESGHFAITSLTAPGWPRYRLAVQRQGDPLLERVILARRLWRLTTRQARVLELIAGGATNKEIARALACVESTIEDHVTELFRRSGARTRAGLVGRLLTSIEVARSHGARL